MLLEDILAKLCWYDKRNPNFDTDADAEIKKEDCYCDNCYYGRTQLAEYILELTEKISNPKINESNHN